MLHCTTNYNLKYRMQAWKTPQSCLRQSGSPFRGAKCHYTELSVLQIMIYQKKRLQTRPLFLELVTGLEPATCSLRMSCTTNCATQAYIKLKNQKCITNELHSPQKYSRTAQSFALLLISSPHFARAIRPQDGTRNFAQLCYTSI